MTKPTEPAKTPDDLQSVPMPTDIREVVVNKLAEILVLDYYHGLGPTDGQQT